MLNLNPDYRYFYVEGITDMRLGRQGLGGFD